VADLEVEVVFADSGVSTRCAQTDTLVSAAKAAGVPLAVGCSMGLCGTCRVRKLEGDVHMVHNGGITDEDVADGYVLACCSKPMGRVVIEA
jgi:ferredoxin